MTDPSVRVIALGAGVQSTTLCMLVALGELPKPDAAIFADTGWEPRRVYEHLDRIERELLQPLGIPLHKVSYGSEIQKDTLQDDAFITMPVYGIDGDTGARTMGQRQCTHQYKLKPIKWKIRELLGLPHPAHIPADVTAEQWIGISTDEVGRARDSGIRYLKSVHPLLDLGMSRKDCRRLLKVHGWESTPKSACIGCPFNNKASWRRLHDESPAEWEEAVAFDEQLRDLRPGMQLFISSERIPLRDVDLSKHTRNELADMQVDLFDLLADDAADAEIQLGCSPFTCRSDGK